MFQGQGRNLPDVPREDDRVLDDDGLRAFLDHGDERRFCLTRLSDSRAHDSDAQVAQQAMRRLQQGPCTTNCSPDR